MSGWSSESLSWLMFAWGKWMASMSLHVTLLVLLLWLADRQLRSTSARLRFMLWLLVLVRLVVPTSLAAPTGIAWWVGDWFADRSQSLAAGLGWNFGEHAAPLETETFSTNLASQSESSAVQPSAAQPWWSGLFWMWAGVVLGYFGFMLLGWFQVRRWLREARPINDAAMRHLLACAQRRVGRTKPIEIRDSGMCTTPLVIGWWRPVILLPTSIYQSLKPAELEAVLVHELMHVARHDAWWRCLQACLGAIYFFHPAVWIAKRMLERSCEEACDEQTIAALSGQRRDYAEAIFKAAAMVGYEPPYLALNMLGDALPVKRRVKRILDPALPLGAGNRWQRVCLASLLALLLIPTGFKSSQAIPPDQAQLSALRFTGDQSVAGNRRLTPSGSGEAGESGLGQNKSVVQTHEVADDQTRLAHAELESKALAQLRSTEFDQRMIGYATLEQVGTLSSLPALESAFLNRYGIEQDAAKRALDRVWTLVRDTATQSTQSSRVFDSPAEP